MKNDPLIDYSIILVDGKLDEIKYVKFYLDKIIPNLSDYLIENENDNGTCFPLNFIPKTYKDCWESIITFIEESEVLEYTDEITEKLLKRYAKAYFNEIKKQVKELIYCCDTCIQGTEYNRYVCSLKNHLNEYPISLYDFTTLISKTNKGLEKLFYYENYIDHFKDNCRLVSNYINNLLFCKSFKLKFECIVAPESMIDYLIDRCLICVCDSLIIERNINYSFSR